MVDKKILDYVKENLDQGVSKEAVKKALMDSGWSDKDINKAFEKVTGQKEEEKKVTKKKIEVPLDKKKIFFIAGGIIIVLILAVLAYFFLFKVGFSEDIPDNLLPGKLNNFIKERLEGYNKLSLAASSPLKDVIQDGKINLIMTNNEGTKVIDAIGVTVENSQIIDTAMKVNGPSFDVKFSEKTFSNVIASSDPESIFLEGYSKGDVKIKAYEEENEDKLNQLNNFVQHFFVL